MGLAERVTSVAVGRARKLYLTGLINLTLTLRLRDDSDNGAHGGAGGAHELSKQDEHPIYSNERRPSLLEPFSIPFEITVALDG
jgi:hypothetical protein